MLGTPISAEAMAAKVQGDDLVRYKLQMDALKERLAKADDPEKQLKKVCQDFEAIFISKIWQGMRDTVPKEGYLHSPMEDQYMSMFDRDFAEKMAKDGGIGLADMLYGQLKQKLENASRNTLTGGADVREINHKDAFRPDLTDNYKPPHPELTAGEVARDSLAGSADETAPATLARQDGLLLEQVNALAERIAREHEAASSGEPRNRSRGYAAGTGEAVGRNLATKG